ncbi:uncharacterized protein CC84DRAFT_1252985 [Paraphaeosphaeria sporulosa]|uniref:Uncharacterized protein n=1 Tax=Paraphaeosphaeria sporulosa TaxID=1460663 RepID=A0A177C5Y5_9PLEO|nr:uncharacterized protein CC84DRAFT_1252985 [Paraphaeosphaeria sporulosa]OAG02299.1 hypothetical protein CC84DRAFT_1252985 [Paraphaeosphaeria sporulosa]
MNLGAPPTCPGLLPNLAPGGSAPVQTQSLGKPWYRRARERNRILAGFGRSRTSHPATLALNSGDTRIASMSSQSSSAELDAAKELLSLLSSAENSLNGTGNHLPALATATATASAPAPRAARVRRWPVARPPRGTKGLKASLVRADVQRYQQRLADEWTAQPLDEGTPKDFWKILKLLGFLVPDYAVAIRGCDRSVLAEFFVKVDCLGAIYGWEETRAPNAKIWDDHIRTIYSIHDVQYLTLLGMIGDYLEREKWQLEP